MTLLAELGAPGSEQIVMDRAMGLVTAAAILPHQTDPFPSLGLHHGVASGVGLMAIHTADIGEFVGTAMPVPLAVIIMAVQTGPVGLLCRCVRAETHRRGWPPAILNRQMGQAGPVTGLALELGGGTALVTRHAMGAMANIGEGMILFADMAHDTGPLAAGGITGLGGEIRCRPGTG